MSYDWSAHLPVTAIYYLRASGSTVSSHIRSDSAVGNTVWYLIRVDHTPVLQGSGAACLRSEVRRDHSVQSTRMGYTST